MNEVTQNSNRRFSEFLSIMYKWKKFMIINLFLVSITTITITLLIDNQYQSSATVIITTASSDMGLTSMLSDVTSLLGVGKTSSGSTEYLLGILGSRELKIAMIEKYNLVDYYEIEKFKIDRTIKILETEYFFEINENGMIDVSFIHKNPEVSKAIVHFVIAYADSVNLDIHKKKARHYREFIEGRFNKAKQDLEKAEIDFQKFQEQTGLYVVPEQIMVNIEFLAELEKNLFVKEIEIEILKAKNSPNSSLIEQLQKEIDIYSTNLNQIKSGNSEKKSSMAFLPTDQLPTIFSNYIKVYREFEIQNKILETLTPLYEQALMDEQKNTPSLIVLDPPFVAELKHSPKRGSIVIIVFLLSFFFMIPTVLIGESVLTQSKRNLAEEKLLIVYNVIINLYKMKI